MSEARSLLKLISWVVITWRFFSRHGSSDLLTTKRIVAHYGPLASGSNKWDKLLWYIVAVVVGDFTVWRGPNLHPILEQFHPYLASGPALAFLSSRLTYLLPHPWRWTWDSNRLEPINNKPCGLMNISGQSRAGELPHIIVEDGRQNLFEYF
jgi:hypothetical protein